MCPARMRSAIVLVALLVAVPASAHHPAAEHEAGRVRPNSFVGFDVEAAAFDFEEGSGSYQTAVVRAEVALFSRFALGLRAPWHLLGLDAVPLRTGLGDVDLSARGLLFDAAHWTLSGGIGTEIPLGDADAGLGGGHFAVSAFLSGMYVVSDTDAVIHASVADTLSLEQEGGHEHVNYIEPHSDHELSYHVGAALPVRENVLVNLVASGVTVLEAEDRGTTFVSAAPSVSLLFAPGWRASLGAAVPVTTARRFDWKVTTGIVRTF